MGLKKIFSEKTNIAERDENQKTRKCEKIKVKVLFLFLIGVLEKNFFYYFTQRKDKNYFKLVKYFPLIKLKEKFIDLRQIP